MKPAPYTRIAVTAAQRCRDILDWRVYTGPQAWAAARRRIDTYPDQPTLALPPNEDPREYRWDCVHANSVWVVHTGPSHEDAPLRVALQLIRAGAYSVRVSWHGPGPYRAESIIPAEARPDLWDRRFTSLLREIDTVLDMEPLMAEIDRVTTTEQG